MLSIWGNNVSGSKRYYSTNGRKPEIELLPTIYKILSSLV